MAFDIKVHFNFENRESGLLGGITPTVLSDSSAGLSMNLDNNYQVTGMSKGRLISKCLFEKIVWTKIPTKNLIDSAQQV